MNKNLNSYLLIAIIVLLALIALPLMYKFGEDYERKQMIERERMSILSNN